MPIRDPPHSAIVNSSCGQSEYALMLFDQLKSRLAYVTTLILIWGLSETEPVRQTCISQGNQLSNPRILIKLFKSDMSPTLEN